METIRFDMLADDASRRMADLLLDCDAAIHIATAIPKDFMAKGAWDANTQLRVRGTRELLAACAVRGVRRYVQQSICWAYPDKGDDFIEENTPLDASPARLGVTGPVIEMERMVRQVPPSELAWCVLRGGTFVGPGTAADSLADKLREGTATMTNDGEHYLTFVHVDDMAAAVSRAVEHAQAGTTYNVCAEPIKQRDYLRELSARVGALPPTLIAKAPFPSLRCSAAAIERELGFRASTSIWPVAARHA